ncbi:MAG TPA: biotin/lipoyl-containing protein [Polyangiaceae bacterium]|nr:biotin/lipoyl-containing protein [Polyangiaceae bacterium]
MRYFVNLEGKEHVIDVAELPGGALSVHLLDPTAVERGAPGRPLEVETATAGNRLMVRVDGRVLDLVVDGDAPNVAVFAAGRRINATVESAHQRAQAGVRQGKGGASAGLIVSPMPGKVVKILVAEGDAVEPGKPLIVVEAMKMENELVAEAAGVVKKVYVQTGDAVEGGAKLVSVGAPE